MEVELIQKLIDLMATTAPELWRIAMQQAVVDRWGGLVMIVVSLLSVPWAIRTVRKQNLDDMTEPWTLIIAVALAFIAIIITLVCYPAVVTGFANPEYRAIELLLRLVQ